MVFVNILKHANMKQIISKFAQIRFAANKKKLQIQRLPMILDQYRRTSFLFSLQLSPPQGTYTVIIATSLPPLASTIDSSLYAKQGDFAYTATSNQLKNI